VNLAGPLTILLRPGIADIGTARDHRRPAPLRKLVSDIAAQIPATNQAKVNPTSIPSTSPASPTAGLAEITPAAPPLGPRATLQSHKRFPRVFAKPRVWLWAFQSFRGLVVNRIFTPFCISAKASKID
jgi:hypothetical protein